MSTHLSITCLALITCFARYVHLCGKHEYRDKAMLLIGEQYPDESPLTIPKVPLQPRNARERYKRQTQLTPFKEIKKNIFNIFFIETSCVMKNESTKDQPFPIRGVVLTTRQLCAIESTARMNSGRPVYILHSCPLDKNFYNRSAIYFQQFWMSYNNVHLVQIDPEDLFREWDDLYEMYTSGEFRKSNNLMNIHLTDIMKMIVLRLFGGTYLDLDVINLRSLDDLGENYAGWLNKTHLGTSVLNFGHSEFAQQFLRYYIESFDDKYDPLSWFGNGPELFTSLMSFIYGKEANSRHGDNFTCYAAPVFHPISFQEWKLLFVDSYSEHVYSQLNHSYAVNFYNHQSYRDPVFVGLFQAYAVLASKYCPNIYYHCGEEF